MLMCASACVCACVRACVRACPCVCVCVPVRVCWEGGRGALQIVSTDKIFSSVLSILQSLIINTHVKANVQPSPTMFSPISGRDQNQYLIKGKGFLFSVKGLLRVLQAERELGNQATPDNNNHSPSPAYSLTHSLTHSVIKLIKAAAFLPS